MSKQFDGAEQSVDAQRRAALDVVAQFGRRGLEQSVLETRRLAESKDSARAGVNDLSQKYNLGGEFTRELTQTAAQPFQPYEADATQAKDQLSGEVAAATQANDTYFRQAGEAVPAMRAESTQLVNQYRQAYEERKAEVAAAAAERAERMRQAVTQQNMMREEITQQAQIAAAQRQSDEASAGRALEALRNTMPDAPYREPVPIAPYRPPIPTNPPQRTRWGWGR